MDRRASASETDCHRKRASGSSSQDTKKSKRKRYQKRKKGVTTPRWSNTSYNNQLRLKMVPKICDQLMLHIVAGENTRQKIDSSTRSLWKKAWPITLKGICKKLNESNIIKKPTTDQIKKELNKEAFPFQAYGNAGFSVQLLLESLCCYVYYLSFGIEKNKVPATTYNMLLTKYKEQDLVMDTSTNFPTLNSNNIENSITDDSWSSLPSSEHIQQDATKPHSSTSIPASTQEISTQAVASTSSSTPAASTQATTSTSRSICNTHAVGTGRNETVDYEMSILDDSSDQENECGMDLDDDDKDQYEEDQDLEDGDQDEDDQVEDVDQDEDDQNDDDQDDDNQDEDNSIHYLNTEEAIKKRDRKFKNTRFFAKIKLKDLKKEEYPDSEQALFATIKKELTELRLFSSKQQMEIYNKSFIEDWLEVAKTKKQQEKEFELEKRESEERKRNVLIEDVVELFKHEYKDENQNKLTKYFKTEFFDISNRYIKLHESFERVASIYLWTQRNTKAAGIAYENYIDKMVITRKPNSVDAEILEDLENAKARGKYLIERFKYFVGFDSGIMGQTREGDARGPFQLQYWRCMCPFEETHYKSTRCHFAKDIPCMEYQIGIPFLNSTMCAEGQCENDTFIKHVVEKAKNGCLDHLALYFYLNVGFEEYDLGKYSTVNFDAPTNIKKIGNVHIKMYKDWKKRKQS